MDQVIYFSRGGNTVQVAKAIASGLGVKATEVANARIGPEGTIFLGSGCYGGAPGPKMMEFIEKNELSGRDVALFGTSGGGKGFLNFLSFRSRAIEYGLTRRRSISFSESTTIIIILYPCYRSELEW